MAKFYTKITNRLQKFIEQQKIFFTDLYKKNYDIVINVKEKLSNG